MYILTTKAKFDSAHFLKGYDGKCANLHGHRWTVSVDVGSETLQEEGPFRGMVVDFGKLKDDLKEETDKMDHALIVETGSLKPETVAAMESENFRLVYFEGRPTAENLAKYFYDVMKQKGYHVIKVSVFETPENQASYTE
ncbi:MAG: 6-carboxytetrahydropterin synthase QueD [Eubacterium sp.]|nr:6-carboxytetrahydropterin synthase QueD [Eubacterium sp.]